ncbi:glycosyltransferase [Pedobacter changchengzhani]|uniref:Glycosyltransferase n=1 Tax=Pedobacter changchengzhani TaxID=2529274 RepID=A0A4R5MP91_9SPHI|nr:glycosyltransferase family 4 protein [Pedobacter changchengzhani]TDG37145.1 glycosyltransferase [Pedobacter changchengzhani]
METNSKESKSGFAPKKILFITPFFGRTGSEMQLFYILQNLDRQRIKPYLFSRNNGALIKELSGGISSFVGYKQHPNFLYKIFRLMLYAVNINPVEFQLRLLQKKLKADCWYINTIANRDAFSVAKKLGINVISHVHELPLSYSLVKSRTIKNMLNSGMCIGCSEIVCEKLEDMGHKNVHLLYGFVDDKKINLIENSDIIKLQFAIKADDFVWVISGNTSTIKGIDFLIPLIKELKHNHKIIWIGEVENNGTMCYAEESVKANFADRVFFTGKKTTDYYDYFNIGHAYLSLSREDSFPLVMIEAAHLGKPIAGFNSGGIKEFVKQNIGIVVDQLNFKTLATAMEQIEANYAIYDQDKIKSYAQTFNVKVQTQKLTEILERYV